MARQLRLQGWVRNMPDGRVEVLAEGVESDLQQLERFLQRGPLAAQVAQVEATWQEATGAFEDFEVRWW
jgi:acylphosphatase